MLVVNILNCVGSYWSTDCCKGTWKIRGVKARIPPFISLQRTVTLIRYTNDAPRRGSGDRTRHDTRECRSHTNICKQDSSPQGRRAVSRPAWLAPFVEDPFRGRSHDVLLQDRRIAKDQLPSPVVKIDFGQKFERLDLGRRTRISGRWRQELGVYDPNPYAICKRVTRTLAL